MKITGFDNIKQSLNKIQKKITPKVDEIINEAKEYVQENAPLTQEKVKKIYSKVKKEVNETMHSCKDAYRAFTIKQPKTKTLKKRLSTIQKNVLEQEILLEKLKNNQKDNLLEIFEETKKLSKLKEKAKKACEEYNKFVNTERLAQQRFEKINNLNK